MESRLLLPSLIVEIQPGGFDGSAPTTHAYYGHREEKSGVLLKLLVLFLGLGVGVLAVAAVWMGASAKEARNDAKLAAANAATATPAATDSSMPGMAMPGTTEGAWTTPSFAGIAPANADALATAHRALTAELPATTPGPVVNVNLGISHRVLSVAPGIKYERGRSAAAFPAR
jgi:hypothetical protein